MVLKILNIFLLPFLLAACFAASAHEESKVGFVHNQGQWNSRVLFKSDFPGLTFYAENQGFTYGFFDQHQVRSYFGHTDTPYSGEKVRHHAVRVKFHGASNPVVKAESPFPEYFNFFYGNNPSNWQSEVKKFRQVIYQDLYPGINLLLKGEDSEVKYDLEIAAGTDPRIIKMVFSGADEISISKGNLKITTSLGEITEQAPVAWQQSGISRIPLDCKFLLKGDTVSFVFPSGYNPALPVTIDPTLVFSSYSGSFADNFGMTATYDTLGNLYSGGIAFSAGYPVTTGAYDVNFTGPAVSTSDVVISKYNANGTALIYSTYLGGSESETISSLVVGNNNELYAYGVTSSSDFPTLSSAYNTNFLGGDPADFSQNGARFYSGTDIYVVHFNTNGTGLIGATLIGGTENDGLNYNLSNLNLVDSLAKNYGDILRGEIIVDTLGNCYIASSTYSPDFPVLNAIQSNHGGKQDAIIFKLDPTLSNLLFSTFVGGNQKDAGYSIKLDKYHKLVAAGGTASSNFPVSTGSYQTTFQGGQADGFILTMNSNGTTLVSSTFFGTPAYDQTYFVETDKYGDIYVYGQTLGNLPVTPGKYSNPNSGQFISKFDNSLNNRFWTSRFGNGNGLLNISPTAFLVDRCLNIYISGWGGSLFGNSPPVTNMPITPNAFQSTTDGYNFYLAAFYRDMTGLAFGTYYGGSLSREHVDGGTSRFDKQGIIYQSVCAGCWGNSDLPTTPGAVSNTNNSSGCNNGVFKYDFDLNVDAQFTISDTTGCIPFTFQFTNYSTPSSTYYWDFGNGDTSNQFSPVRTYTDTGVFQVSLIVTDTVCNLSDTFVQTIHTYFGFDLTVTDDTLLCDSTAIPLVASTGGLAPNYHWSSDSQFTDSLNSSPTDSVINATPATGTYYVTTSTPTCSKTDSVKVLVHPVMLNVDSTIELCYLDTVQIIASNLIPSDTLSYSWSPAGMIVGGNGTDTILVSPQTAGYIYLNVSNQHGCSKMDSVFLDMANFNFLLEVIDDSTFCKKDSILLYASNNGVGQNYIWSGQRNFSDTLNLQVIDSTYNTYVDSNRVYYIKSTVNGCTQKDSVVLTYAEITVTTGPAEVCQGNTAVLTASVSNAGTGLQMLWSPATEISGPFDSDTILTNTGTSRYFFIDVSNAEGCADRDSAYVTVHVPATAIATAERDTIYTGQSTPVLVSPPGTGYTWTPETGLDPVNSGNPVASPESTTTYLVSYFDSNNCRVSSEVEIIVLDVICEEPFIYLPNAFSPNGDGMNDQLFLRGNTIEEMQLMIYDRWGNLVFQTTDQGKGWDGTYKGKTVDPAVFVYHLNVRCIGGAEYFKKGNITVLR